MLVLIALGIAYAVTEFSVTETELVDLHPDIADPDGDIVTYRFSAPLDENGKWQTSYGDAGLYNITITASDGKDETTENITLTVNKKNEAPVITKVEPDVDSFDVKENEAMRFAVNARDANNDELNYKWLIDGNEVSNNTFIIFKPGYDKSGKHGLAVEISDGVNSAKKEWSVNVIDVDRAPFFAPIKGISVKEGEEAIIFLNATDPDGDEVKFEADNLPKGAILDENKFYWKTDFDTVAKNSFFDSLKEKYGLLDKSFAVDFIAKSKESKTFQRAVINVRDVNRPPVLFDIENITVNEGEEVLIAPNAVDPDGDKIEVGFSGWIDRESRQTNFDDSGEHEVIVTASDGGFKVSMAVNVKVVNVNRKPVFKPMDSISVFENETARIKLKADDADTDEISFGFWNGSERAMIEEDVFIWKPDFDTVKKNEEKEINFDLAANDGEDEAVQRISVKVKDVNRAPEILSTSPEIYSFAYLGDKVVFDVNAKDLDGDKVSYTWRFVAFEEYKGKSKIARKFSSLGKKKVSVVVSDGEKQSEFVWNVHVIKRPKK